jgi:replicative DNA helicase
MTEEAGDLLSTEEAQPLAECLPGALDLMEALGTEHGKTGRIPTGFQDLDMLLGGLWPGAVTVIASRPAMGTSTLLNDFCRCSALRHGLPTLLVNYESTREEVSLRLMAAESRVALYGIRSGLLSNDDWDRLAENMARVAEAPLHIATPTDWTLSALCEQIEKAHAEYGVRLVAVDCLQYIRPDERGDTREREITEIIYGLKALALKLSIPIVIAAQLNRQVEARTSKLPDLHTDLRDSDAVAHVADVVILLFREDAYVRESPRAGEADILVAKHRHGPVGTVTVAFQGHYSRFVDMAPH